jgi:hypothetical protein
MLPTSSPKEEPEDSSDDNDPKNRVHDNTQNRGDHHDDDGYQDVDEHWFASPVRETIPRAAPAQAWDANLVSRHTEMKNPG